MTLYEAAMSYEGVPWKHLGRSRKGLDCGGLPLVAFADKGIQMEAPKRYGRNPFQDGLMKSVIGNMGDPVWSGEAGDCPLWALREDDVVVMAPASLPRHLAIVGPVDPVHGRMMIHADGSPGVGRVVSHGLGDFYLRQIVSVFRREIE